MSEGAERRVSATELAELAEVTGGAVSNWRRRHPDFPQPGPDELFSARAIAAWLDQRKITASARAETEQVGITFGERFRRNLGWDAPERKPPELSQDRLRSLWGVFDLLRGALDPPGMRDLVLSLIYLRDQDGGGWNALTRASPVEELRELFDHHELRPLPVVPAPALAELIQWLDRADLPAATLFDQLLSWFGGASGTEIHTPESIVRTMTTLLAPRPGERIHDPWCAAGNLLTGVLDFLGDEPAELSGHAMTEVSWRVARMNLAVRGIDPDLGPGPAYALRDDPAPDRVYDVVLTNPPFDLKHWGEVRPHDRRWRYGKPPQHSANFAWLQHCLAHLTPRGRAAVLMTNNAAGSHAERDVRESMVRGDVVEAVIALPPNLFDSTGIPVSLWLLRAPGPDPRRRSGSVLLIDASDLGVMSSRTQRSLRDQDIKCLEQQYLNFLDGAEQQNGLATVVTVDALEEHDFLLSPRAHVRNAPTDVAWAQREAGRQRDRLKRLTTQVRDVDDHVRDRFAEARSRTDELSWRYSSLDELSEVTAGPGAVKEIGRAASGIPVLAPRNLRGNRIVREELSTIQDEAALQKLSRYRLAEGDILGVRTGLLGRHALITEAEAGWLFGTACLRIRPIEDSVDPRYLLYYLGTPPAQDWILRHSAGSTVPSLNVKTLRSLPIALPGREAQQAIGASLGALDDKIALHADIQRSAEGLRTALSALVGAERFPFDLR